MREEPPSPHSLLVDHKHELTNGVAIDVACGLGQNTRWLANNGYQSLGLDISLVALQRARGLAVEVQLVSRTLFVQHDLDQWSAPSDSVDLICVFRFLDRSLFPTLRRTLRPGGLIFYETRHYGILQREPRANPEYLLKHGELLEQFGDWFVLYHQEAKNDTSLVARKPA